MTSSPNWKTHIYKTLNALVKDNKDKYDRVFVVFLQDKELVETVLKTACILDAIKHNKEIDCCDAENSDCYSCTNNCINPEDIVLIQALNGETIYLQRLGISYEITEYQNKVNKLLNTVQHFAPKSLDCMCYTVGVDYPLDKPINYRWMLPRTADDIDLISEVYGNSKEKRQLLKTKLELEEWNLMASDIPLKYNMETKIGYGYHVCSLKPYRKQISDFLNPFGLKISEIKNFN